MTMLSETRRAGETVRLIAADGHELGAYLARPQGRVRGGLVLAQDAFGIGDYIRSVCDFYAAEGYATIAPAVYDRQERDAVFDRSPESHARSQKIRAGLNWDHVLADVAAASARVSDAGKIGIVGFCVGGSITWLAAAALPFAAASSYYGRDVAHWLDKKPRCPMMLHFGDKDHLIPLSDVEKIRAAHPEIPTYVYPAGHGFDNPARGFADSAKLARARTLEFFRKHIGP